MGCGKSKAKQAKRDELSALEERKKKEAEEAEKRKAEEEERAREEEARRKAEEEEAAAAEERARAEAERRRIEEEAEAEKLRLEQEEADRIRREEEEKAIRAEEERRREEEAEAAARCLKAEEEAKKVREEAQAKEEEGGRIQKKAEETESASHDESGSLDGGFDTDRYDGRAMSDAGTEATLSAQATGAQKGDKTATLIEEGEESDFPCASGRFMRQLRTPAMDQAALYILRRCGCDLGENHNENECPVCREHWSFRLPAPELKEIRNKNSSNLKLDVE